MPDHRSSSPREDITSLRDWSQWWEFRRDDDWRHPPARGSNIHGLGDHPVVHIARAHVLWAGKDLSTEAEWA